MSCYIAAYIYIYIYIEFRSFVPVKNVQYSYGVLFFVRIIQCTIERCILYYDTDKKYEYEINFERMFSQGEKATSELVA